MAKASRTLGVAITGRQLINNFIFLFEYLWRRQRKEDANSDVGSEHVPIPAGLEIPPCTPPEAFLGKCSGIPWQLQGEQGAEQGTQVSHFDSLGQKNQSVSIRVKWNCHQEETGRAFPPPFPKLPDPLGRLRGDSEHTVPQPWQGLSPCQCHSCHQGQPVCGCPQQSPAKLRAWIPSSLLVLHLSGLSLQLCPC